MIAMSTETNGNGGLHGGINPYERERNDPNSPAYAGGQFAKQQGVFALPHVITFSSVFGSAYRTYSWRWDEAYRQCQQDAWSMRRDAFLMGIIQERQLASSQLPWHIECENPQDLRQKKCAEFISNIIKRMRGLPKFFYNLQDAVWFGRCGNHIAYNWRKSGDTRYGAPIKRPDEIPGHPDHPDEILVPERYYPINGDKIQYRYRLYDDGPEVEDGIPVILVHSAWGSRLPESETVLTDRGRGLLLRSSYWRERFVIHNHTPDDADFFEGDMAGGIYGVGIRSRIYWIDWIRKEWLANISDYIQRVGQGTIILYYEAGNPQSEAQAIQVGNNISQNTVIVWPRPIGGEKQGAGIDMINPPMSGSETLVKLMEHMEQIEERYIIGQSASSRSQPRAAGSDSQDATKYNIVRFDAANAGDTCTHEFVQILMKWNCPQEDYQLKLVFQADRPNIDAALNGAYKAWTMGAKIREDNILEICGLQKADPETDDILENPATKTPEAPEAPEAPAAPAASDLQQGIPAPSEMPGQHGGPRSPEISGQRGAELGAVRQSATESPEQFAAAGTVGTPQPAKETSTPTSGAPSGVPSTPKPLTTDLVLMKPNLEMSGQSTKGDKRSGPERFAADDDHAKDERNGTPPGTNDPPAPVLGTHHGTPVLHQEPPSQDQRTGPLFHEQHAGPNPPESKTPEFGEMDGPMQYGRADEVGPDVVELARQLGGSAHGQNMIVPDGQGKRVQVRVVHLKGGRGKIKGAPYEERLVILDDRDGKDYSGRPVWFRWGNDDFDLPAGAKPADNPAALLKMLQEPRARVSDEALLERLAKEFLEQNHA